MFPPSVHAAMKAALAAAAPLDGSEAAPLAAVDTHVVLECLLWRDESARALREAIEDGRVIPLASRETFLELAGVSSRPEHGWGEAGAVALLGRWGGLVRAVPAEALAAAAAELERDRILCRDPEDQKFLALALACGASLIVTRDRLLRKAAKKLRARGVEVRLPEEFAGG